MKKYLETVKEKRERVLKEIDKTKDLDRKIDLLVSLVLEEKIDEAKKTIRKAQWETTGGIDNFIVRREVDKIRKEEKKKLTKMAKIHFEIINKGLVGSKKVYKRGLFYRYYVENSRAEDVNKSRARHRKPDNVSVDYTTELWDEVFEGPKRKRGEIPTLIYNEKKAKILLFKLKYQFLIKKTTLTFKDKDGNIHKAKEFSEIEEFIKTGNIDLKTGIYANQIHHLYVDFKNFMYANYSFTGIIKNLRKRMSLRKYNIFFYTKKGNQVVLDNAKDFEEYENFVDWDKRVRIIESEPEKINTKHWNEEYDGYWLKLSKLSTEEQVNKYRHKHRVVKPIKAALTKKFQTDFNALDVTAEFFSADFDSFSYEKSNKLLETGDVLRNVMKYNMDLMPKTFRELEDLVEEASMGAYQLLKSKSKQILNSIIDKFAKILKIETPENFKKEGIKEIDYYNSEKEIDDKTTYGEYSDYILWLEEYV